MGWHRALLTVRESLALLALKYQYMVEPRIRDILKYGHVDNSSPGPLTHADGNQG